MRTMLAALALTLPIATPAPPQEAQSPSPLRECMEGMKAELKGVAMALQEQRGDDALAGIAAMQALVLRAKLESPPNLDQVPEAERAAHRVAFRKDLIGVLRELSTMEERVLDGDLAGAFQVVVDPLYPLREAAHEKYQRRD